jgi:serine protease Do
MSAGRGEASPAMQSRMMDTVGRAVVRVVASSVDARSAGVSGLGFVVDRRGYVLTQDQLVRDAKGLVVALVDGRKAPVKQVWRDPLAGVAVLKIDDSGLTALQLGDSSRLRVGDAAIVLGWSTVGAAPSARATIRATGSATGDNLVIDAPISAEYVGSPLIDLRGQVVGMAIAEGFAIPIDRARATLRRAQSTTTSH